MASYRCSVKPNLSRGKGQSLANTAAYQSRDKVRDERTGETFDYTRHPDKALWTGIYAPKDAPDWAKDLEQLTNAIEKAERYKNAQLARPIELNLPHELTLEENRRLLQDYIRENFTRKDYAVLAAIHAPGQEGDERNIHAHLLISLRTLDADGFARTKAAQQKADYLHRGDYTEALRESWAKLGARHLERAGQTLEAERWRHGHQTLAEQREAALERGDLEFAERCDREPGKHLGPFAAALESAGVQTERGDLNREIAERNRERAELRAELREAQAGIEREETRQPSAAERADESVARFQARQQQEASARALEPSATRQLEKVADGMERGAGAAVKTATRAADTLGDMADRFMNAAADFLVGAAPPRRITEAEWRASAEARKESAQQTKAQVQHRDTLARMLAEREANRPIDPEQVRYLDYAAKQEIRDRGEPALNEMLDALAREERQRLRERSMGLERER